MNRMFALLIVVSLGCLFVAGKTLPQAFAQPATASDDAAAAPPAAPAVSSAAAQVAPPTAPAPANQPRRRPVPPVPVSAGAVIRSVGPNGGGTFGLFEGFDGGVQNPFGSRDADDPEMAKLTQSEHELSQQSTELMTGYAETEDYQAREKLKAKLREVLAKQFDAQRQRRELELSRIEERLSKLREQLKKRDSARETIIDRRLETLTSDAEGLGWTAPAAGSDPLRAGAASPFDDISPSRGRSGGGR